MGTRAEACCRKAERCKRIATVAVDPDAQRIYSELARQWRQRAAQAEALEHHLASRLESVSPDKTW
jgi:hypothetical protein